MESLIRALWPRAGAIGCRAARSSPPLLKLWEMDTGHTAIKLADWRGLHTSSWLGGSLEEVAEAIRYSAQ